VHKFGIFILKRYNLESIAATDFNFGMKIFTSSRYTHKEFCATCTSGFGQVSAQVNCVSKIVILCLTLAVHRSVQEAYSGF